MLASITPLGERGRRSRWKLTASAFLLAASASGAGAGALLGSLGALLLPAGLGAGPRLSALSLAALAALAADLAPPPVPGPRRQVDERWRERYRGWVYGAGYGAQLGLGVTTVVASAATYVALLAAFISAGAGRGAVVVGLFGAARGAQPLATFRIRRPEQLVSMHRRFRRWQRHGGHVAWAGLLLVGVLAAARAMA
jgi:hypothetical protein